MRRPCRNAANPCLSTTDVNRSGVESPGPWMGSVVTETLSFGHSRQCRADPCQRVVIGLRLSQLAVCPEPGKKRVQSITALLAPSVYPGFAERLSVATPSRGREVSRRDRQVNPGRAVYGSTGYNHKLGMEEATTNGHRSRDISVASGRLGSGCRIVINGTRRRAKTAMKFGVSCCVAGRLDAENCRECVFLKKRGVQAEGRQHDGFRCVQIVSRSANSFPQCRQFAHRRISASCLAMRWRGAR